jgi:hypothetical protein
MTLGLLIKGNAMNFRLITVMTAVLVITTSSGCSGMRNFLFGRGAACGNCPTPGMTAGIEPGCGHEQGCGHEFGCGHEPGCGHEASPGWRPMSRLHGGCGLFRGAGICNGSSACNCGGRAPQGYQSGFSGMGSDPYSTYPGEIIGSEIIGDTYGGYPGAVTPGTVVPGTISGDNFGARSGERIIGVDPQPIAPSR